jgi:hypothetical protein
MSGLYYPALITESISPALNSSSTNKNYRHQIKRKILENLCYTYWILTRN